MRLTSCKLFDRVCVLNSSVRVSNELGAGNPKSAAFSVVVVTALSFILSVIISAIILLCRDYISYIFTEGEDVSRAVSRLTPLLAFTLILNGIQPVLSGMQKQKLSHTIHTSTLRISRWSCFHINCWCGSF